MIDSILFIQAPSHPSWFFTEEILRFGPWVVSGLCILFALYLRRNFEPLRILILGHWLFMLSLIVSSFGIFKLSLWTRKDIMTGHITLEPILESWTRDWLLTVPSWIALILIYLICTRPLDKNFDIIKSNFKINLILGVLGFLLTWFCAFITYQFFQLNYYKTYSFVIHFYENWFFYWLPFFFSLTIVLFLFVTSIVRLNKYLNDSSTLRTLNYIILSSLLILVGYKAVNWTQKTYTQNIFLKKLTKIEIGMNTTEVEEIIGQPDIILENNAPLASFSYQYRIPESLRGSYVLAIDSALNVVDISNYVHR